MSRFFFDASALAKRYFAEAGTDQVNEIFARVPASQLLMLRLGLAEVVSMATRRRNAGQITAKVFEQFLNNFDAELAQSQAVKIEIAPEQVDASIPIIISQALNATDAVLLRAALDLAKLELAKGTKIVLVAADRRLIRAARAEGLSAFDPELDSTADLNRLFNAN